MPFHRVDDEVDLFYTDQGQGPEVLLLHGWACDSHDWSWLIPHLLDRGYRVVAVDHRGHGKSSVPANGYNPQRMAHDAASLLRALDIGPTLVIGHSLGTLVGSALAVEHPDLVRALVLVDPVYNRPDDGLDAVIETLREGEPQPAVAAIFRAAFYTATAPEHLLTWHERRVFGTPAHVVRDTFFGIYDGPQAIGRSGRALEYLQGRKCPRLAVYAGEELTWLERQLPTTAIDEIAVIEGGHWLHQERPDEFHAVLESWLNRLPRTA